MPMVPSTNPCTDRGCHKHHPTSRSLLEPITLLPYELAVDFAQIFFLNIQPPMTYSHWTCAHHTELGPAGTEQWIRGQGANLDFLHAGWAGRSQSVQSESTQHTQMDTRPSADSQLLLLGTATSARRKTLLEERHEHFTAHLFSWKQ